LGCTLQALTAKAVHDEEIDNLSIQSVLEYRAKLQKIIAILVLFINVYVEKFLHAKME
jgi:uncharacterized membrane protein YiaA